MDCPNAQNLLDAYLDGELDALRSSEIADHLHGCAGCAQSLEERQTIRSRLKSAIAVFQGARYDCKKAFAIRCAKPPKPKRRPVGLTRRG